MQAKAFSPASVGNVGVGFDILGHAIAGVGDTVSVRRIDEPVVRIVAIRGTTIDLPLDAPSNTAGAALIALRDELKLPFGFEVEIDKGIPLGSGMGGSASSCVAALVAANELLDTPLSREALYPFALVGEAVASGGKHGDNLGPMLLGGVVLATAERLVKLPVPQAWHSLLVHPEAILETRRARAALQGAYELKEFVQQSANLSMVLAGCFNGDADLVRAGLNDVLVEPRRAPLIVGFDAAKQAMLDGGAFGASISGAGPSVFGWFASKAEAEATAPKVQAAFAQAGFDSQAWVSPLESPGAVVL
ncbi:MAG: homoserine kinase [Pseudoxanthomonas sp.]